MRKSHDGIGFMDIGNGHGSMEGLRMACESCFHNASWMLLSESSASSSSSSGAADGTTHAKSHFDALAKDARVTNRLELDYKCHLKHVLMLLGVGMWAVGKKKLWW
jgi:hypothetical protein